MRCMASFLWLSCIKSVFSFAPAAGASVILLQPGKDRQAFLLQPLSIIKRRKITETRIRSEEHTSELQSLMRISYAVFCLKKKIQQNQHNPQHRESPSVTRRT